MTAIGTNISAMNGVIAYQNAPKPELKVEEKPVPVEKNEFVDSANEYGLRLTHLDEYNNETEIPYLEFSALKKTNLGKLKQIIQNFLKNIKKV